ncbi:MAG TPA: isoaspartyl peptidase/L-asparaginase, partial [Bacteroidia bacterium]|nr:isoaspartyl peptidase/L-asparaginase [Bacteroidia bacterium]
AATSTGGVNNKKFGRIGDSPLIGSGTYANNKTCAVSCTGEGEYFIRNVVAYDISALMEYKGFTLAQATAEVMKKVALLGGEGGLISIDNQGTICAPFNTSSMFRGWINTAGEKFTAVFR